MTVIKPIKSGANGTGQEKPLIYALQQELEEYLYSCLSASCDSGMVQP